jgi:hypothetical protein
MTVSTMTKKVSYPCRLLRHAWDVLSPAEAAEVLRESGQVGRNSILLRCMRCHALRHDQIDTIGGLQSRRYDYPDEYRTSVEDRPSTSDLRLWILKRNRSLKAGG